jgi:hypothetical protein
MAFAVIANAQKSDTLKTDSTDSLSDSLSLSKLDSIFSAADSLSIFTMIDSLLNNKSTLNSSLVVRAGFNTNIVSAGRTIGVNQYGATGGASYYHKTGLYADVTAYWSEEYNPSLYVTIASVGYLKAISSHYSFLASYDRLIYNNTDINVENPLTNMVGLSNFVDIKPFTFRLDYSYYFGQERAHRLTPAVMLNIRKYNFIGLDRLSISPSFQMLFGSSIVTSIQFAQEPTVRSRKKLPQLKQIDKNEFGLMNYSATLPIRITKKNWSLTAAYTYNWPVALTGESQLPQNSFFSLTISKTINFK